MRKHVRKIITSLLLLLWILPFSKPLYAINNGNFSGKLLIRQEISEKNGVLVCQPVKVDMKIVKIINNNNINSLDAYIKWLEENVKYQEDEDGDVWLNEEKMLDKKKGDCEDYALLNIAFLRVFGYKPKLVIIKTSYGGHAICVFEENGYYSWIDNNKLIRTEAKTFLEFSKYLCKDYDCYFVALVNKKSFREKISSSSMTKK